MGRRRAADQAGVRAAHRVVGLVAVIVLAVVALETTAAEVAVVLATARTAMRATGQTAAATEHNQAGINAVT